MTDRTNQGLTPEEVGAEIQQRPQVYLQLTENALTVAESLRDNYFRNTAKFISHLRQAAHLAELGKRDSPIFDIHDATGASWDEVQQEVVTFIDGGVGEVEMASQVPILLRVGSYAVKTGERNLSEREQFGYYPVILGDLEGGSKERKDYIDIVRITAELLGGLSALRRQPNLRMLMFHGPLVYLVGNYAGHTPFTENDIDVFLHNYANDEEEGERLKEEFLQEARVHVYPEIVEGLAKELAKRRLFEPVSWICFLYRKLIEEAKERDPTPIIAGVVERGNLREFSERVILDRVFQGLRKNEQEDYFNEMYGRDDLNTESALLDRLGYTDPLLLSMLLEPGEYSEPWNVGKYGGLRGGEVTLNWESRDTNFDWSYLRPPGSYSFPRVKGAYLSVNETTKPVRVEVFSELGGDQIEQAVRRTYLYASLLPGYGFPVGLDVVDKHAKVPDWLTGAYEKLIRHHLGVSLQSGEIEDSELRRILVQSIYMTNRDWIFRPES